MGVEKCRTSTTVGTNQCVPIPKCVANAAYPRIVPRKSERTVKIGTTANVWCQMYRKLHYPHFIDTFSEIGCDRQLNVYFESAKRSCIV